MDARTDFRAARWYAIKPARNHKPATYRCPLCDGFLPALSDHLLVYPEGDSTRRRHAHTACVTAAAAESRPGPARPKLRSHQRPSAHAAAHR